MKTALTLFMFLAVLLWSIPGVRARGISSDPKAASQSPAEQAQALLDLSGQQNSYNHPLALQSAQQALVLWQALGDNSGIARAHKQIARCYVAQSDLPEATEHYQIALQLERDLNNLREQAEVLIMLGYIEDRKGEWQNSISFFTQAQEMVDEKNEPDQMGRIAGGLAYTFNESGLPEAGLIHYQRAFDYYRRTPDARAVARMILQLGNTYYLLGKYPEALSHLQQALTSFEPESLDAAQSHEYLGRVYSGNHEPTLALQHLQPALDIYERAFNPREAAQVRALIGQVYQQQGNLKPARRYYRQALQTFAKLDDRLNQAAVYYALGRLELQARDYDAAEIDLAQSIRVTEDTRRAPTSRDLTAAFSATVHQRYESYIECLMHKHHLHSMPGIDVRAFEISELGRARSLSELLRATQTNLVQGLDPKLAEKEKSLRQSLRVKADDRVVLSGKAYKKEELDALGTELERLEAEYKQVTEIIRARYPAYEQITRPEAWDLRRIQQQVVVDDQTTLLEYSLGADKSYVWAVTRDSIKSYDLPAESQIVAAAGKVYKSLKSPPSQKTEEELTSATRELSRMILSPVVAELNKRRVIVVADGALNYIPFQVLPTPLADNEPLVTSHEVINAPSASILGELRQEAERRQPAAKVLAAFGDAVFALNYAQHGGTNSAPVVAQVASGPTADDRSQYAIRDVELGGDSFEPSTIGSLFFAKRELAALRDLAGDETLVAAGFEATREKLKSTDLSKYAIIHFATHGILDPRRPENSGLFLSMFNREGKTLNGFVGLQEIYGLRAPVDLVVLSACSTGLGKDVRGEGLISLTRGFMYAGASSVVASLWSVEDEATAELMKRFYTNMLQRGMTPASALRDAQNSIRQEPQWRSPYYWAAFTFQGDYRHVIKTTPVRSSTIALKITLGVLLILLAGAFWFYRRHRGLRMRAAAYSTVKK